MTTAIHTQHIGELLELAAVEEITLPLPAETIARLEDGGAVVDLITGAIVVNGREQRYSLTLVGEANAVVWQSEARR